MSPLDIEARRLVVSASKRVSVVTAISPRAAVDMIFVLVNALRMIRQLAVLYGGRPGALGVIKLLRQVLSHLAVTGGVGVADGLVQQVVGHGLAARLSARLGEGMINGLLTARLGLLTIDLVRPLPFHELPRPALNDLAGTLLRPARRGCGAAENLNNRLKNRLFLALREAPRYMQPISQADIGPKGRPVALFTRKELTRPPRNNRRRPWRCPITACVSFWKLAFTSAIRPTAGTRRWVISSSAPATTSTSSTSPRACRCCTRRSRRSATSPPRAAASCSSAPSARRRTASPKRPSAARSITSTRAGSAAR